MMRFYRIEKMLAVNGPSIIRGANNMAIKRNPPKKGTFKVGRDAKSGQFITVAQANRRPNTTVVETIKKRT
jgi:hypothetical protein